MINIKADSRKIKKGDIFIALRGFSSDGHDYIDKAIENGASKLIVMDEKDYPIPYEVVPDTRIYLENYLKENYGKYLEEMTIVGYTGTNGKTTSCYLLYDALNKLGVKAGYIGTVGFYLESKVCDLPNTSPDICDLYEYLIDAYDKGYRYMTIEASSQGLVRRRLETIPFKYAVFTNLTEDHLDEHKTMEGYANAKKILFDCLSNNSLAVLNFDDKYKDYFKTNNTIYYGFNGGDYKVVYDEYNNQNTIFKYLHNNKEYLVDSPLLGKYNVYNLLSVIAVLDNMGFDINKILEVVKLLKCPPGRIDIIKYKTNSIVIDYAHTPDAMENVFALVNNINHNNVYTVFGCTGSRERTKRPIMMDIATKNSKYTIVTIDDPHEEDIHQIFDDMLVNNTNTNYEVIEDRGEAIKKGISLLNNNDILLILGKGHEEYIVYKDKKVPFNDRKKVEEILEMSE